MRCQVGCRLARDSPPIPETGSDHGRSDRSAGNGHDHAAQPDFRSKRSRASIAGPVAAAWSLWPGRDQAIDHLEALSTGLPFQPWNLADLDAMPHHQHRAQNASRAFRNQLAQGSVRTEQGGSEPLSALWEYWDSKVWRPFRNSSNLAIPARLT
ncbi:MAG: hypothetical protein R2845_07120 [Thermomicrobiales bacterium]